jgi:DNA-binding transcriptional LysR family regulator
MILEQETSAVDGLELSGIDLASITQTLLVAECLSFRRAAKALHVHQSAISRRVRSLEDTLGVSLFERYSGGVRITAAGAEFIGRVRSALVHLDHAIKAAGAAGRGETGVLRIGICSSISTGLLRKLTGAFCEQHPQVGLEISELACREHIELIWKRRLDAAFVTGAPSVPDCETVRLWTERVYVVLPQVHTLCAKLQIEWEVLRDERFILRQSDPGPAIHDHLIKRFADLGYHPSVRSFDVGRETAMHLVALGLGVSITSEATIANSFPGVEFRPIAGDDVIPSAPYGYRIMITQSFGGS